MVGMATFLNVPQPLQLRLVAALRPEEVCLFVRFHLHHVAWHHTFGTAWLRGHTRLIRRASEKAVFTCSACLMHALVASAAPVDPVRSGGTPG